MLQNEAIFLEYQINSNFAVWNQLKTIDPFVSLRSIVNTTLIVARDCVYTIMYGTARKSKVLPKIIFLPYNTSRVSN